MHKLATYQQPSIFFVFNFKYLYELFEAFLLYSGHMHTCPTSESRPASVPTHLSRPFCLKLIESSGWRPNILICPPLPFSLRTATVSLLMSCRQPAALVKVMSTLWVRAEGACPGRPSVPFLLLPCLPAGVLVKPLPSGWFSVLASSHLRSELVYMWLLSEGASLTCVSCKSLLIGVPCCSVCRLSLSGCFLSVCTLAWPQAVLCVVQVGLIQS